MSADIQPVTQEQIDSVIATITTRLEGVFVTPSALEPILQDMVNGDNTLAPIADTIWNITQHMHKQMGEAITLVAMHQAMMQEFQAQRDIAISKARDEGYQTGIDISENVLLEQGALTFGQGVLDNGMDDIEPLQAEAFSDAFYDGKLDEHAKQLLRDLILYVWVKSESDMGEVVF